MQDFLVELHSEPSKSFRCIKAANALDINLDEKLSHELRVRIDVETQFSVGLIAGASGSGKTTLARKIWGAEFETPILDNARPVIDQFPSDWTYDDCAQALTGMGLSAVPCWIRVAGSLSNGQRARAEAALRIAKVGSSPVIIDEWTSVVDRTVAKAMSLCVAKHARRNGRQIVLLSCHYDIVEWLSPDWMLDCNTGTYSDWRGLRRERAERLDFEIRPCRRATWKAFSRYHYLSSKLPGGHTECFGLFHRRDQVGFICWNNHVPHTPGTRMQMHGGRIVIHPDYCGFGLGIRLIDETAAIMTAKGYDIRAKFSSVPLFKSYRSNPNWKFMDQQFVTKVDKGSSFLRTRGFRKDVATYSFKWVGQNSQKE